jgi:ABC-2 type transport system permease protein
MKLRVMRNTLRGRRAVQLVLGMVFGLVGGVGTAFLSGLDFADAGVGTDIAAALFAAWTLGWLFTPVLTGGSDETLQPEHFRLLPIPPRKLATGFLAVSLVGVAPVATLVAFGGLVVRGSRFGVGGVVVGVLAAALQLVFAVLLSRVVLGALGAVLRSRRGRDLGVLLAACVGLAYLPVRAAVQGLAPILLHRESPVFSAVLRALPSGWGAVAVAAAGRADWLFAVLPLLGLLALSALLVLAWSRLLVRRMTTVAAGGAGPAGAARRRRTGSRGLLPATPVGAVAGKELRTWWRDARRRVVLLSAVMVGLAVPLFSGGGSLRMLPYAGVWVVAMGCLQSGNLYGFDGTALWQTLVTPGAERADVRGRQLAWLLIVGPVVLVASLVLPAVAGHPDAYPFVLGLAPALLGGGAGLVLLLSTYAAYPVPNQRNGNPFASGGNPGCARALRQVSIMLLLAVVAAPVVALAVAGSLTDQPVLSWLAVPVGVVIGAVCAWGWGRVCYRRLAERGPELLAAVKPA